jgi:hypothetical protein
MSGERSSLGKENYYSFCGRPEGKKHLEDIEVNGIILICP